MSFTADQVVTIAEICGKTHIFMLDYLAYWSATILTPEIEAQIIADITLWLEVRDDFINIHPNTENRGAEIMSDDARNSIRNRVRLKLNFPRLAGGFTRLQRV